jgi:hypothetical protein
MPTDRDSDEETPDEPHELDELDQPDEADLLVDEDADYGIADPDEGEQHTALPPKVEGWRKRSATGAVLTGFALGLQSVFEPKKEEPSIVLETSGDPPRDLPVEADMEYRRPRQTVVNIRPWLLDQEREESMADPTDQPDPPGDRGAN